MVASIEDTEYEAYCKKLGLSPDKVKDKGILIADYLSYEKRRQTYYRNEI